MSNAPQPLSQNAPAEASSVKLPLQPASDGKEPHSIEAEQALLGAIMLDNKLMDEVDAILRPHHFYVPFHEQIYETMQHLIGKGWAASPLTLRDSLRQREVFETDGDLIDHLTQLAENASLATDISALAHIVHNHHQQRQLLGVARQLGTEASGQLTPEDTEQLINDTEQSLFTLTETSVRGDAQQLRAPLKVVLDKAYEAKARGTGLLGVTSGLIDLDKKLGGFQHSDLIILAARPSMGKTALAINVAYNAAKALMEEKQGGTAVGVFSLEMSADQLAARILASAAEIPSTKMDRGELTEPQLDQLAATVQGLSEMQVVIDDTPALHIAALRSRARRMVRRHNVGLIVVDYIQLMQGSRGSADGNRVQEISEISQGLKSVARELNIPIIALSQLSRAVESRENKRPQLSDLRESGSIEQDADVVMFIYREEYYKEKQFGPPNQWTEEQKAVMKKIHGVAELLISKNRKGPTGGLMLQFTPETTTFHAHADAGGYEDFE